MIEWIQTNGPFVSFLTFLAIQIAICEYKHARKRQHRHRR